MSDFMLQLYDYKWHNVYKHAWMASLVFDMFDHQNAEQECSVDICFGHEGAYDCINEINTHTIIDELKTGRLGESLND